MYKGDLKLKTLKADKELKIADLELKIADLKLKRLQLVWPLRIYDTLLAGRKSSLCKALTVSSD